MEQWRDVVWYEWIYQVSNMWNVKNILKNSYMSKQDNWKWYKFVNLSYLWWTKRKYIHRLVLISFLWSFPPEKETNHKNWIKSDNRLENLEFVTKCENQQHSIKVLWKKWPKTYLWKFWKEHNRSIWVIQLDKNNNIIKEFWSMKEAERETWIKRQQIWWCCVWKHKYKTAWWFKWKYQ